MRVPAHVPTAVPAVVLAGQDPGRPDPLAAAEGKPHKALVEIVGRPLIAHVVRALAASPRIGEIAVVGLPPDVPVDFGCPVHRLPNRASLLDNAQAGVDFCANLGGDGYVLVCGGDAPLLSGEAVTWFVDACRPFRRDVYWAIVARAVVESVFPTARRTWVRTADGEFCSADLFLVRAAAAHSADAPLRAALAKRKRPLALVRLIGPGWIVRLLLGRAHVRQLLGRVQERFGIAADVIVLPFPGAAMDVDKPQHLALLRNHAAAHPEKVRPA
jgi:molybdopterin-guanine dinucleotide biosynthesis protein A